MSQILEEKPNLGGICWASSGDGKLLFEVITADLGRHVQLQTGSLSRDHIIEQRDNEIGRSLMNVALTAITPHVEAVLRKQRAGEAPWELELAMKAKVLLPAERNEHVLAGVEAPIHADSRYIRFDPGLVRQWQFDLVAARAIPLPSTGGILYEAVRVFTLTEWANVEKSGGRLAPTIAKGAGGQSEIRPTKDTPSKAALEDFVVTYKTKNSTHGVPRIRKAAKEWAENENQPVPTRARVIEILTLHSLLGHVGRQREPRSNSPT